MLKSISQRIRLVEISLKNNLSVNATVCGHMFNTIVDTGATINVIDQNTYAKIKNAELKYTKKRHLRTIVQSLSNSLGNLMLLLKPSIFIPLPKKPKAQKCTEFLTISLMTHISKLLLKIIQQRIADKIDKEVSGLQSGFRPEMGTREGIFNLRTICKRILELNQDVYIYVSLTTRKLLTG